jgi:predicted RNA binding protein YcfA (HicA-like mRNA interferase family)
MSDLPSLTAYEIIRALERGGFVVRRSKGSHHRLVHADDPRRATTVAVHGARTVSKPLVLRILKQAGLTVEEFRALL